MNPTPEISTPEKAQQRSAYQAVQPPRRPAWADVDLDLARRPGVPHEAREPKPFPNTIFPPERQPGEPAAPMHGRPNKRMPPVFGTSTPLRGLSGVVRRMAYTLPDHYPSHWLLKMLGDRVELWETRARRMLPIALPLALLGLAVRAVRR
jgi:hypothetical protein